MGKNLIGERAYIKPKKGQPEWNYEYRRAWGTIIDFDGDYYQIQMFCNGPDPTAPTLDFERREFVIRRKGKSHESNWWN